MVREDGNSPFLKRRSPSGLAEYWEILRARFWWVLATTVLVSGVVTAITLKLPKTYRSKTMILVQPQAVPTDYVKPTVTTDIIARLDTISQEVLSRTSLQDIIKRYGLYQNQPWYNKVLSRLLGPQNLTEEDQVDQMRKDTTVENVVDDKPGEHSTVAAFRIEYEGSSPALAQEVTRELGALFIEANLRAREHQAEGTSEFIDTQLEAARGDLDQEDKRLAAFKAAHMGALPEQEQTNLQVLGQFQAMLQENADAQSRAQDQKVYFESLLNALTQHADSPSATTIETQLETLRAQLAMDQKQYQADYPEIRRVQAQIGALEELDKRNSSQTTTSAGAAPPGSFAAASQIRSQMTELDSEIKERTQEQKEMEGRVQAMQTRLQGLPATEQQLSEIMRDYAISKTNYEKLLDDRNASAMAAEMERRAKGEQFRVLDPASYPDVPYSPNVERMILLGCLGGILAGCVVGLLLEYRDDRIKSGKDVAYYFSSIPLLAYFPVIQHKPSGKRRSRSSPAEPATAGNYLGLTGGGGRDQVRTDASLNAANVSGGATPAGEEPAGGSAFAATLSRTSLSATKELFLKLDPLPRGLVMPSEGDATDDGAFTKEQFRILRTRLVELNRIRRFRTLMVTSAVQREGKTLVAANLAFAMSQLEGMRVLLVDGDLRRAGLGDLLRARSPVGLSTYLQNGKGLEDVRLRVDSKLSVVPTLCTDEHSAALLSGNRMRHFLDEALRDFDLVVIDAPPLLPVADAQMLTSLVDAVLMVVRSGYCPYDLARAATELLQPKVIGLVLNSVERLPRKGYYYGYYGKPGAR